MATRRAQKDECIRVMATRDQKRAIERAAASCGLGMSPWLLSVGLKASQEIEDHARAVSLPLDEVYQEELKLSKRNRSTR